MSSYNAAYVSKGKIFLLGDGGEKKEVTSKFAEDFRNRAKSIAKRTDWKKQGSSARFQGASLWGEQFDLASVPVFVTGIARGHRPGTLVYALSTGVVGGVFELDLETLEEKRLFHSAEHRIEFLSSAPHHRVLACSLRHKDGTTSLAVMSGDGSEIHEVTEGDSVDLAPCWIDQGAIRDERRHVLCYQSSGVGRDAAGMFVALGPSEVQLLDAESGDLQTIAADPKFDFFAPRMTADRTLYCIRHPYVEAHRPKPLGVLKDTLLFPFRLLAAFASYLNFFSYRYTGKPLLTSGDARKRGADLRQMYLMGNMADAIQTADRQAIEEDAVRVGSEWALVKIGETSKAPNVVASAIRAFDVGPKGVLATDGVELFVLEDGGKRKVLGKDARVSDVLWIP